MHVGLYTSWILGYFLDWRTLAYLATIPGLVMWCILWYIPESPYWLIEHDMNESAERSLGFFRTLDSNISEELDEIKERKAEKWARINKCQWTRLFSKGFWEPFSCIGIIWSLNMLGGPPAVTNYLIPIMEESGSDLDPNLGLMVIGMLQLLTAVFVPFIVQKMEPRTSFTVGQILKAISMGTIAAYFYFHDIYPEQSAKLFSWIPLIMITLQHFLRSVTIIPVLYTLVGELFPTEIRAFGVGIVQSSYFTSGAVIVKTYPDLKSYIGLTGLLSLYTCIGLFNSIWGYLTIPDNRSKSLIEVEESYDSTTPLISK